MFSEKGKQMKASFSISVFLLIVLFINWSVIAQTNPMDSTPSKTDIFTQQELLKKMGATTPPSASVTANSLPFPVDNKYPSLYVISTNMRPPIMDQGSCGACVAYSTSTVLSTMLYHQTSVINALALGNNGNALTPDPMVMFNSAKRGCNEGDPNYAWNDPDATNYFTQHDIPMLVNAGVTKFALPSLTIRAGKQGSISNSTRLPAGITKFDAMRKFIATQGALGAQLSLYPSFNRYKTGIYNNQKFNDQMIQFAATFFPGLSTAAIKDKLGKSLGGHAMTVIGYFVGGKVKMGDLLKAFGAPNFTNLNNELDLPAFWVVQNSWGSSWGVNGLVFIEANQPGLGFDDVMYYMMDPIVKKNGVVVKGN